MNKNPGKNTKIFVAGHLGMVGAAILRVLEREECELLVRTRQELDLTDQRQVREFFEKHSIDQVYLAAAKVGGIHANNTYPADFIHDNLMIELNVIHEAWRTGVRKMLMLGSSCIYPKVAPHPMAEDVLLTGPLEATNEPYAIAKISGIKICESYNRQYGMDYRSVMPTNLYGPGDNYHPENSHVIPGLLRRFHEAKVSGSKLVQVWGTGTPRREFLHVNDMARACVHVMALDPLVYARETLPMRSHLNVGSGMDISIREVAELIAEVIGFQGEIRFDPSKPDGAPKKLMDSARLRRLGWEPTIRLKDGLRDTYQDLLRLN